MPIVQPYRLNSSKSPPRLRLSNECALSVCRNPHLAASKIQAAGGKALGVAADVLDKASLHKALDTVLKAYGRVDILINGAGGNRPEATALSGTRTFFDLSPEALQWVFNLNLIGSLQAAQVFGKPMTTHSTAYRWIRSDIAWKSTAPFFRSMTVSGCAVIVKESLKATPIRRWPKSSPRIRMKVIALKIPSQAAL